MRQQAIDLNCDVGESFGCWSLGDDNALMRLVSSANVACGFHAGDPHVMRRTAEAAAECGVGIGAHPGLPDLAGFGRRSMALSAADLYDLTLFQIGALRVFAEVAGLRLQHVKPHGALVEMALHDESLATAMYRATRDADSNLIWLSPAGKLVQGARQSGLRAVAEFYADRAYHADGRLVSRKIPGALIHDPDMVRRRVRQALDAGTVSTIEGSCVSLQFESICVHGDTPGAVAIVRTVRSACDESGVSVKRLAELDP